MDALLSAQFDRVEKALGTLVDSIAAYNPSPQAALDLVAADDALSQGLDQLARHQANHARIQSLRTEADALDDQLRASVAALASLRHELFDTPATTFPADARPVHFDDLLQYAKNISQHTVPPTYREHVPQTAADKDSDQEHLTSSAAPTNGANTPANPPALLDTQEPADAQEHAANAPADITAEEQEWLKKLRDSKIAWYPWPSNDKIQTGNLYKLMYWQAMGKDTDDFDIYAHEEVERLKNLSGDLPPRPSPESEPVQVPQAPPEAVPPPAPKPSVPRETFDAFDDLDDE
ncbi:mediator of RNA polymerase II transcription subunit 4 [Phaeosphaeria sp. MPI-PUGE-AT-0046c]|nr:mediator of RNA polymerase II transcription subunit 4 [Phaeosphaeria sp. MPI-PUGE-AT-0046c]